MVSKLSRLLLALSLGAALTGCIGSGSSQSNTPPPTVTAVSITPNNSAVSVGKGLQFSAKATYSDGTTKDITSTAIWQVSDSTVASVSGGNVSGEKPGVVNVRANSGQVSATTLLNVTSKNFSNGSLKGPYAFNLVTGMGAPAVRFEVGSMNADGNGHISGVEDINGPSGVNKAVPVSGTYAITADGRGTLTLTTSGETSRNLRFVLSANSATAGDNDGLLIEFDGVHNAIGSLAKQDSAALANTALAKGTYVFRLGGLDGSQQPIATVGAFTLDSTGATVTGGSQDVNDNGTINNGAGAATAVSLTNGSVGAVDPSTGRATASLVTGSGTTDLVIYVVSASKIQLLGVDADVLIGTAELQAQPAPSSIGSGGYLFQTDIGGVPGQFWMTGQFGVNSTSQFTEGGLVEDGRIGVVFINPPATITVANGRGTFKQGTNLGSLNCTFYMISSSRMYVLQTNDPHAGNGVIELQVPGTDGFASINLNNTFTGGGAELGDGNVAFVVQYVSDGLGHIIGIEDLSQPQSGNPSQLSTSTIVFQASFAAPNSVGGVQFTVPGAGAGVTGLAVLLQSASGGAFVGQPNDVDGWLTVQ